MKMLYVEEKKSSNLYFVTHMNDDYGDLDKDIAEMLEIELDEYINMMKEYDVILYNINDKNTNEKNLQYFFTKEEDAEKFVQYLNEVYVVILKLKGVNL